jgi:hypothetical protein
MMHRLLQTAVVATLLLASIHAARADEVCGERVEVPAAEVRVLKPFVAALQINRARAAIGTISHVNAEGRLPDCYLSKRAAEARGWRPGGDLWRVAPGSSIGGDVFGNREGRLPPGQYLEADLDYVGGRRGPVRLVFQREGKGQWRQWITTDHYNSFRKVPAPQ